MGTVVRFYLAGAVMLTLVGCTHRTSVAVRGYDSYAAEEGVTCSVGLSPRTSETLAPWLPIRTPKKRAARLQRRCLI
jgi:hypothetical protein